MSSFLPNIVVRQAVHDLNLKVDLDDAALQEKIRAGLERLYAFQHEDGGWGWWETDESHPFMTAYVVAGLVQAKAAGTQVKDDVVAKGATWLAADFTRDPKLNADLRAYMAYALAMAGPNASQQIAAVYNDRAKLSGYGVALVGMALPKDDARAATLAASLESGVQQDAEQAWWAATRDPLLDFSEDASAEATALRREIPVASKARFAAAAEGRAMADESSQRRLLVEFHQADRDGEHGLTDYLRATKELNGNITATVYVNGSPVLAKKLDQTTALTAPELVLDESKLKQANHIRGDGSDGRVYYFSPCVLLERRREAAKDRDGFAQSAADYFKLAPAKDGDKIVYDLNPLNGPVAVGDIVAVRLTVTGSEWKYLMVEDPIPAGTEFIERDSVYDLRNKPPWWQYFFTRRELHDDRMALFQTYFAQGQQQYFYLLKVVNPGVFQVSPRECSRCHQPGVMATSEAPSGGEMKQLVAIFNWWETPPRCGWVTAQHRRSAHGLRWRGASRSR